MAKIKGLAWTLFDNVINASHASPFLKMPDSINELRKKAKMRKMHVLTDMYFSFLRDKVSRSRGWPLTCYVAEDDLELLDPTTSASQLLGLLPCSLAGMYSGKSCMSQKGLLISLKVMHYCL